MVMTALPTDRLFVALDLPDEARDLLLRDAVVLRDLPRVRIVPRDNLHITVRFVGRLDADPTPEMWADLFDALAGPVHRIRLGRWMARPAVGRARLVVAEAIDEGGWLEAHAERIDSVIDRCAAQGRTHPFRPHVTVARFSRPTPVRRYPHQEHEHVFDIDRISLYHSEISGSGPPTYRSLMTVPLVQSPERKTSDG